MTEMKQAEKPTVHIKLKSPSITTAEHFIRMVGMGDLLGCTLIGPPGMGKTHMVRHVLDEMKVPYTMYGGHITLAEVYEFLYENRESLIFFDDVSQVINKTEIIEMLKQALNLSGKSRILNYRSKGVLSPNVPNHFEFTGRIIFAFNTMDTGNPNVKAIMDRAPPVELKFSRKEIIQAFYDIAENEGGGLMEYEKLIVVKEVEDFTDSSVELSLRKLFISFNMYASFKRMYGEGNLFWKEQVQRMFGRRKESWMRQMVRDLVGEDSIKRTELAKEIALKLNQSPRNAQRKINEFLELEEIFQDKAKGGQISIKKFV